MDSMTSLLIKYGIYTLLVILLLLGAFYYVNEHDKVQQKIGADKVQVAWDAQILKDKEYAKVVSDKLQKDKDNGEIKAQIRVDAANKLASAAVASSKLLDTTVKSIITSSITASNETNRKYIAAFSSVFGDCKNQYTEMGQAAQGHANDSLKLQQEWPVNTESLK